MSSYTFDQAAATERERLGALEDLYDDDSMSRLAALGVGEGWRCLEVGCGAGGVARWLAARVGPTGHVVATDLYPRFMQGEAAPNLDVRRHDIVTDPLEESAYDLVHARAVLEHIPARVEALAHMVRAVRPGGWVVIEDTHFAGPALPGLMSFTLPAEQAGLGERIVRALEALFVAVGADANLGPKLPGLLRAAGLVNVEAELHGRYVWGGRGRDFGRLTVEQVRGRMVGAGLVTEEEVERFLALTAQPEFGYMPLPLVTAWGQRPAD